MPNIIFSVMLMPKEDDLVKAFHSSQRNFLNIIVYDGFYRISVPLWLKVTLFAGYFQKHIQDRVLAGVVQSAKALQKA